MGRKEAEESEPERWQHEKDSAGFQDGRVPPSKEYRRLLESGKGKKPDSLLGPPEGVQPCQHLDCSPATPVLDF